MNKLFSKKRFIKSWKDLDQQTLKNPDSIFMFNRFSYGFLKRFYNACVDYSFSNESGLSKIEFDEIHLFFGNFVRYMSNLLGEDYYILSLKNDIDIEMSAHIEINKLLFLCDYNILLIDADK